MTLKGLDAGQKPALVISEMQVAMTHPDSTGVAGLNEQVRQRGIVAMSGSSDHANRRDNQQEPQSFWGGLGVGALGGRSAAAAQRRSKKSASLIRQDRFLHRPSVGTPAPPHPKDCGRGHGRPCGSGLGERTSILAMRETSTR